MKNTAMKTSTLLLLSASLLLTACASKPAPKTFNPDAYSKVVRLQNISIGLPIHSPAAKYPSWQAAKRQDGWVLLEYTILSNGLTDKIHILDSSPKNIFDQNAINAVKQYRYQPIMQHGRAVSVDQVRSKITFDAP